MRSQCKANAKPSQCERNAKANAKPMPIQCQCKNTAKQMHSLGKSEAQPMPLQCTANTTSMQLPCIADANQMAIYGKGTAKPRQSQCRATVNSMQLQRKTNASPMQLKYNPIAKPRQSKYKADAKPMPSQGKSHANPMQIPCTPKLWQCKSKAKRRPFHCLSNADMEIVWKIGGFNRSQRQHRVHNVITERSHGPTSRQHGEAIASPFSLPRAVFPQNFANYSRVFLNPGSSGCVSCVRCRVPDSPGSVSSFSWPRVVRKSGFTAHQKLLLCDYPLSPWGAPFAYRCSMDSHNHSTCFCYILVLELD